MSFERLGKQLAREQDALRARTGDRAAVREQLAALRVAPVAPRRRLLGGALLGVASLAAAAAAVWGLWLRPAGDTNDRGASPPLAVMVEGSPEAPARGAFVEAPARAPLALRFSDGTHLRLSAGGRARLVELEASGAHVLLESGELQVDVVPKPHARWRMSAGPFLVRVTGTRFDLSWDPDQDQFELDLASGHVEVAGCVFGQGYRMHSGQRIHASCKRGQFEVAQQRGAPPAPAIAAPAVAAPAVAAPAVAAPESFEQRCAVAGSEQLMRLAEAARYAGELEREALAWRALRRRFPGTARAALAAFALGRQAFDVRGEHRKAAEWFGTYLKEQPNGPLAREARGRLIEATLRAGERERARSQAQAYLREYPDGPHADLARTAIAAPLR